MPDLTRIEDRVSAPSRPTSGDIWTSPTHPFPPAHESLRACVESGKLTILSDGSFRGEPCPCHRCAARRNQSKPSVTVPEGSIRVKAVSAGDYKRGRIFTPNPPAMWDGKQVGECEVKQAAADGLSADITFNESELKRLAIAAIAGYTPERKDSQL